MIFNRLKERLLTGINRNIFVLGLVSFLTDVSSEMICPLLPLFLTSVLGASTVFLGVVEGVAESTASILKLYSGWFSDRLKKRKILILGGYSLSSISRPLVGLATASWHVLLTRFFDRAGKGIRTSPRDALIADSTAEKSWGKAFSFHRAMDHFGAVIGPIFATIILAYYSNNYRLVFLLAGIPGILAIFLIIFYVKEQSPHSSPHPVKVKIFSLEGFDHKFKIFLVLIIIFTLGNSSDAFLILRAQSLGVTPAQIPIIWLFLQLVKMLSSVPGGHLSDLIGRKKIIVTGWIIYALVYFGFALANQTYQIWLLFGIYGLYFGLTEGTERALVADLVPPDKRGTAYGVYNAVIGISALPASVLMGLIWKKAGIFYAFSFGSLMAALAALSFLIFLSYTKKKSILS